MSRQTLKDDRFRIIGHIDTDNAGKQTILDDRFHKLGYYDPRTNTTTDARFHKVGTGNLLASLLPPRR